MTISIGFGCSVFNLRRRKKKAPGGQSSAGAGCEISFEIFKIWLDNFESSSALVLVIILLQAQDWTRCIQNKFSMIGRKK